MIWVGMSRKWVHTRGAWKNFNQKTLSGKKKQHKHKLFGPDFPRTFLTLTPGCPGVKKFLPTTGAAGKRTLWCGRPRFSARTSMTRRVVEKLCTKKVRVDFLAPTLGSFSSPCSSSERKRRHNNEMEAFVGQQNHKYNIRPSDGRNEQEKVEKEGDREKWRET